MNLDRISVLDLETDPFEHGKMIWPFLAGFYDGKTFTSFWSQDCCKKLVAFLRKIKTPLIIYAHNGGRFDFFYFLEYLESELRIVNSRIIQAWIGPHELRDSYAIMPFALETYKKTPIDYDLFKAATREHHREQITSYLRDDCVDLHTLCIAFLKEFGNNLTIGGASMKQLKQFHKFNRGNGQYDSRLRSRFYFGGRNQCFRSGIIHAPVKIYDVNSMYPFVMSSFLHPVSTGIFSGKKIDSRTSFVSVEGRNFGAFPVRREDNSLDFTESRGIFNTSIHEFEAALETKSFIPTKIHECIGFSLRHNFDDFVTHFYEARKRAKDLDDKIRTIFYKFVLNSAYGKFAQNPENYSDFFITKIGTTPPDFHKCRDSCPETCAKRWTPSFTCEQYVIWERPLQNIEHSWYNVATGASITGASRAVLLRGISNATNPYYCDTDSIICTDLTNTSKDPSKLGAWKLEEEGDCIAICGKKLYAVYRDGSCVKKAHKGALLTGDQILQIASGDTVESYSPVPSFKFDGSWSFTQRSVRQTHFET
jgi:DNA polymerase type B, organellar and viral